MHHCRRGMDAPGWACKQNNALLAYLLKHVWDFPFSSYVFVLSHPDDSKTSALSDLHAYKASVFMHPRISLFHQLQSASSEKKRVQSTGSEVPASKLHIPLFV